MTKPQFDGPIKGYLINQAQLNLWRFESTLTMEEVLQEGYIAFMQCAARYGDTEPKHFMSLYKRTLYNRFNDLATADTRVRAISLSQDPVGDAISRELIGELENEGYLRTVIRQAPTEVAQVIALFLNAPAELLERALRAGDGKDSGGNRQVAQWLGLPPGSAPLDRVREYFESA